MAENVVNSVAENVANSGADITQQVIPQHAFNVAPIANMPLPEDYDSAIQLLESVTEISDAAEEMMDEWPEIEKDALVNRPFVIVAWTISDPENSDYGSQYVIVRGMTTDGKRFRFADGSTGVYRQLVRLTAKRLQNPVTAPYANMGLKCLNGLTKSDYTKTLNDGSTTRATTHYIQA